ncbi:hypothetical protein PHMEG_000453 [Phytophthora megakarya]|uniref:Uncharacterized protein n=1 Tax=Phytophthora megakarya TaxID=4795 RepID=A0A225X5H1_9STRA|nr:hypothetical protein PHMEG_000453 [Phytophthora megakarya]
MKRALHRPGRSPSAASSPDSQTHTSPSAQSPRRAASASAKTLAASNGSEFAEKRPAAVIEAVHSQVVTFATSALAAEREYALRCLCDALVPDSQPSDTSESGTKLLNERDTNTLVTVSAQRLRGYFSRALELFNAGRLDGNLHTTFLLATESEERAHVMQMLLLLKTVLVVGDNVQALLLVGERIPSTFVKVVKALHDGAEQDSGDMVTVILDVLAMLVTSPEVVQELNESSTLHRIFHLAFADEAVQMGVLKVMETLIQNLQPTKWRWMVKQLYEEHCLLELIDHANGTGVLAKAVLITALSLRGALTAGLPDLHKQMHTNRQRHKIFTLFVQLFESRQDANCVIDPLSSEAHRQGDQALADAVAELCLSGSETPLLRGSIYQNKAFKLAIDAGTPVAGQSFFNPEAFGLLLDILEYMHRSTKAEKEQQNDSRCDVLENDREQLECRYLQILCKIIMAYRFDYEFVSNTNVIVRAIEQLNEYSEMAQHTVLSVLSAISIETRVIPYAELAAVNLFVRKDGFQSHSIHALLAFIANLLRFDQAYHEVLRSVGLMDTLVALFLDQTNAVCTGAGSTHIRVEYPTNTQPNDEQCNPTSADEKPIVSLLKSHCRQRVRRRDLCRNAISQADYLVLIDIMKLFADGVDTNIADVDQRYFERTLCRLQILECVCILIGDATFQQEALALWTSIVRLSLILQVDDANLRNVVNCITQAVRYVTLAIYFPKDGDAALGFPGNVVVLQESLTYIELLLRPKSVCTNIASQYATKIACINEVLMRDRLFGAFLDCDIILSLLGVLCAVARQWEINPDSRRGNDASISCSAIMLSLQSIFSIVTTNDDAEQLFCWCVVLLFLVTHPCIFFLLTDLLLF